jgi:predicted nucleic acid-binding protein
VVAAPVKAVLDANVLFPFTLRDTLLRAAASGMFQMYWSAQILDEARRNLVGSGTITELQASRLLGAMSAAFPEASVTGHESLIATMRNHVKDRHVVAAAVKAGAEVVVTSNLKDFRHLPNGIGAQSPDDFLGDLFDIHREAMVTLLRRQAAALSRPARTLDELLAGLAKLVPRFVRSVREHLTSGER